MFGNKVGHLGRVGSLTLAQRVSAMFSRGEPGAWYDPSDLSTLFQDSAGTVPVTAVEQPVGRILDKSGRGNHAIQATTTKRPVLQQDGNGKYYLAFDGVDDSMATAAINFTATDKMTVVAGVRSNLNGYSNILELGPNSASENGFALQRGWAANGDYAGIAYGTSLGYGYTSNFAAPDTSVIAAQYDIAQASVAGGEISFRRNGVVSAKADSQGSAGTGNFSQKPLYIGSRAGTSLPFNGRIYSLIVRGAQTPLSQIEATERYIKQKMGLP